MAYTRHGWHIEGTPEYPKPEDRANCGGPENCLKCLRDLDDWLSKKYDGIPGNEIEADVYDWPAGNVIGKAIIKSTGTDNTFVAEVRIENHSKRGWIVLPLLVEPIEKTVGGETG